MKLDNPDDRITVSEAAKLTGLSRQQLRRLWTRGSLTPPIVSLHDGRERLLLRQEIEEVLPKDDDHLFTVTLAEFAQRLGLSTQTVRARYRDHGRLIQGRLCFREDFVISMLAHTWGGPPQEFTVSTLDAARQIGCHVNTLSRRLKRKGLRKGRTVYFRQSDVDREEWRFRRDQLVDEFEVMRLLGAKHPVQVYFLTAKTACHPVLYMWNRDWGFPKWYGLVARMPAPHKIRPSGQWLWKFATVEEWAERFRTTPEKFMERSSIETYHALGAAEMSGGKIALPNYGDRELQKETWRCYLDYERWRSNEHQESKKLAREAAAYHRRKQLRNSGSTG